MMIGLVVMMRFPGIVGIKCEAVVEFSLSGAEFDGRQSLSNNHKIDFVDFA